MQESSTQYHVLPVCFTENEAFNAATQLFIHQLITHFNESPSNTVPMTEDGLADFITKQVYCEIEAMYQGSDGYLYTNEPMPITDIESWVYVEDTLFKNMVSFLSKHIVGVILPEVTAAVEHIQYNGRRVTKTQLIWSTQDPTTLAVEISFY